MTWGPDLESIGIMVYRHECDPNFDPKNFHTWYDGDLVKFKTEKPEYLPQHLFEIVKISTKEGMIRIKVNKLGHGLWVDPNDVVHVARPIG